MIHAGAVVVQSCFGIETSACEHLSEYEVLEERETIVQHYARGLGRRS